MPEVPPNKKFERGEIVISGWILKPLPDGVFYYLNKIRKLML